MDQLAHVRTFVHKDVQVVARTKFVSEEHTRAQADHFSVAHYADSVSKDVGFIHVMSCDDHYAVALVLFEHGPDLAPRF